MAKIYLASFFFDESGFEFTEKLAQRLEAEFSTIQLYVPHRNTSINDKRANDKSITATVIYEVDTKELLESDILIANIDGVEIDSGVATEIGVAVGWNESNKNHESTKPIYIIGLYTDIRQYGRGNNRMYKNLYVIGAIKKYGIIVNSTENLLIALTKYLQLQ